MKKVSAIAVVIFLTLIGSQANASIDVPTFRFGLGQSPLSFTAGSAWPGPNKLGEMLFVNPMFLWDVPNLRMRIGISFQADLGSAFGTIAIAGVGGTVLFYPLGLSSSREVTDDFSEVVKTRMSPYFQISIIPSLFSATLVPSPGSQQYATPQNWPYFNATMIELAFGIGMDYPFSRDLVGFLGLHYRSAAFTAGGSSSGGGSNGTSNGVSYSGIALILGIMTNFY